MMKPSLCLLVATLGLVPGAAEATNYSLWIHGLNVDLTTQPGNYNDWTGYWGSASTPAGVNKKSVNWVGTNRIASENYWIRRALDCYCTGNNWCYIAVHSAGDLQIGYALSMYGGSTRYKKNTVPDASGTCGNLDGTTQVGWNIKWIDVASGGGGGSELADLGYWAVSIPVIADIVTTTARSLYDHNNTRSKWFYMFPGAKGQLWAFALPGQDDEALAYHSTGGVSGTSGGAYCNPGDFLCTDLTPGSAVCENGQPKWAYHTVAFLDYSEQYGHDNQGSWAGIVSKVREDMVTYAW